MEFASATLEDGTKITNDKGSEFAVGDKVFVEVDGEKDPAPAGDHITESGITITLDDESIITGMKRPDEEGEGSEGLAEEEDMEKKEEMSAVETEETTESEVEEAFEESKEEEMEEEEKMEDMPKLEDMISVIAEVVEEKMAKVEEKMGELEKEMMGMKEKMEAFASEPAETSTTASNFSSVKNAKLSPAEKRYEAMLNKLQTK